MQVSGSPTARTSSTLDLVRDVIDDFQHLVRQEVALARAELREAAGEMARAGGMWAAAGLVGFLGFAYLTVAGFIVLQRVISDWAAALVVGGALLLSAVLLGAIGTRMARQPKLRATVHSLKEDREWIRRELA